MTGVVPGSGAGAGTVMWGEAFAGGRITPSDCSSLSLKLLVEPVSDGPVGPERLLSGSTFSAGIWFGAGMFGACWFSTPGFCARAAELRPAARIVVKTSTRFMGRSFGKATDDPGAGSGKAIRLPWPAHWPWRGKARAAVS